MGEKSLVCVPWRMKKHREYVGVEGGRKENQHVCRGWFVWFNREEASGVRRSRGEKKIINADRGKCVGFCCRLKIIIICFPKS